jgi:hypothetical protein
MRRFQVRAHEKEWTDRGPDLLRTREGAGRAVGDLLERRTAYVGRVVHRNESAAPWVEIGRRAKALKWLDQALEGAHAGDRILIGCRKWGETPDIRAVVRVTEVPCEHLDGATPGTELVDALYKAAFPTSKFAGAYVCKQIEGTSQWSDHAWGDAIDRTSSPTAPNDALTDWGARMAADGAMPVAYLLGSQNGKVVQAEKRLIGSWKLKPSTAASSHLWHVHVSIVKHTGTPPCAR